MTTRRQLWICIVWNNCWRGAAKFWLLIWMVLVTAIAGWISRSLGRHRLLLLHLVLYDGFRLGQRLIISHLDSICTWKYARWLIWLSCWPWCVSSATSSVWRLLNCGILIYILSLLHLLLRALINLCQILWNKFILWRLRLNYCGAVSEFLLVAGGLLLDDWCLAKLGFILQRATWHNFRDLIARDIISALILLSSSSRA